MIASAACNENPPHDNPQTARENGYEKVQDMVGYWFLCERGMSTLTTVPLRDFSAHGVETSLAERWDLNGRDKQPQDSRLLNRIRAGYRVVNLIPSQLGEGEKRETAEKSE